MVNFPGCYGNGLLGHNTREQTVFMLCKESDAHLGIISYCTILFQTGLKLSRVLAGAKRTKIPAAVFLNVFAYVSV